MNLAQFPFRPSLPSQIVKKVIVKIGHSHIILFVISDSYERKINPISNLFEIVIQVRHPPSLSAKFIIFSVYFFLKTKCRAQIFNLLLFYLGLQLGFSR